MEGLHLKRRQVSLEEMSVLGKKGTEALMVARRNSVLAAKKLDVEQYGYLVQMWNEATTRHRERVTAFCHARGHSWREGPFSQVCIRCCATGDSV